MDLLTVQETAAMLKVNPETVRRHIASGRLPAVRIGRRVRIPREALRVLAVPIVPKKEPAVRETLAAYGPRSAAPLTKAQIRRRRQALADSETLIQEILARRGGEPLPPSWPLIREARDERSAQI